MRTRARTPRVGCWALVGAALAACGSPPSAPAPSRKIPAARTVPARAPEPEPLDLVAELELSNPSAFPRASEPVYLAYYDLGLGATDPRAPLLAARFGDATVPSQHVDRDGNGKKDGLLLLVALAPAETKTLRIIADEATRQKPFEKLTHAEISYKTGGSWQPRKENPKLEEYVGGSFANARSFTAPPEHTDHSNFIRYEGPGIESDKVGYRIYLDWRNGFDIFGKKLPTPVLQDVGQDGFESYHHMADWGMDILKVGESLGTGGFGYLKGGQLKLVSDVRERSVTITEDGSLMSSFRIDYEGVKAAKQQLDLRASFSMHAGSRLVHTELGMSDALENLVVGVVKHPETELVQGSSDVTGKAFTYLGSWGQQSLSGDMLGMAVLFRRETLQKPLKNPANYAALVTSSGGAFEYYFLAAWQGEPGGIQNKDEFVRYLDQETEQLTMPVRQRLKTRVADEAKAFPISAERALGWAKKLADSELQRKALSYRHGGWDENRGRKPRFEYDTAGLLPLAYDELNQVAPDPRYAEVMEKVTGSFVSDQGNIAEYEEREYNIDAVAPGRNLLRLYERTRVEKYKKAADRLRRQLKNQPKTAEGAFWHKKKYPSQVWLDGVYMGLPFLARYSETFENGKSHDQVVGEFSLVRKQLKDPRTGLYFHGWDEKRKQGWADPETGRSKHFWARGLGWYAMALVDVLDILPSDEVDRRKPLLEIISELGPALAKVQDGQTGTWWQILDQPGAPGNYRESSASAMFTYFFAKAARKGYLPASYRAVAQRSFEGLVREFVNVHPDGKISMTQQCLVGGLGFGRDGSYRYYMSEPIYQNDPKGTGPFILAGVETYRLLKAPNKG